jgi:phage protein U
VTQYRWPAQERFMQGQALQFVGIGEDTITLPGVIYPEFRGGLGQLNAMRDQAGKGQPLTMLNGQGMVMGRWVIEKIEERGTVFGAAGVARKIEFTLDLRKFDDDGAGTDTRSDSDVIAAAMNQANQGNDNMTGIQGVESLTGSVSNTAGGFADSLMDSVSAVTAVASDIGSTISSVLTPVQRAMDVANGMKNAATDAKRMLQSTRSSLAAKGGAQRMLSAATSAVSNAGAAGTQIKRSLGDLQALGSVPQHALNTVQNAMVGVNRLTVYATQAQESASKMLDQLDAETEAQA